MSHEATYEVTGSCKEVREAKASKVATGFFDMGSLVTRKSWFGGMIR